MKIIFALHDPRVYQQTRGTCYAHAIAEAIVSTELRIIGRRVENHTLIVKRIVRKHGYNGASLQKLLRQECLNKSLRFSFVTQYEAEQAVLKGRVIVVQLSSSKAGWRKFEQTLKNNAKASISRLEQGNSGHAAAIIGMITTNNGKKKSWIVKNAWGKEFADNGTFRIKMYSLPLIFIDVYFTIDDLTRQEKRSYESYRRLTAPQKKFYQQKRLQFAQSYYSYK